MSDLFVRALSEGLQALVPIAFWLAWARRISDHDRRTALRWCLVVSVPFSLGAGYFYQSSSRQSLVEAGLAIAAIFPASWFAMAAWESARQSSTDGTRSSASSRLLLLLLSCVVVVRQLMLVVAVLVAAVNLRSLDAVVAVSGGVLAAIVSVALWTALAPRLSTRALFNATLACSAIFLAEVALYAVHKSSEARLLPWSEPLETATEPYGPDGLYGLYISYLLIVAPVVVALFTTIRGRFSMKTGAAWRMTRARWGVAIAAGAAVAIAAIVALVIGTGMLGDGARGTGGAPESAHGGAREAANLAAAPHLLFKHARTQDLAYGSLAVAPLDSPDANRATADMHCDRVSFSRGHGICLQSERRFLTSYSAVLFDSQLQPQRKFKLEGPPSRTRISPDGRVGAVTSFVTGAGHGYIGGSFSTKTILIDMASGDLLGDLEQFATWRGDARFQAADFNFWGVTFAQDSNVFYATLKSGQQTYLVRGDLGLRKLTVLRENVECPSLSPDNRLIAFKKRVGPVTAPWRFYVLDVATMTERPVAGEARSIDDQIEWLDNDHVLYAVPRQKQPAIRDVWIAPLDQKEPARLFLPEAESPIVVR